MKATEARLLDFLKKSSQFEIPIYQRAYSWTEKECRQLWDDIVRCGSNEETGVHFVGSIVYIESGLSQVTHHSPLLVIDGQQRLTTVTLLLAVLAEFVGDEEPFDGFSRRKVTNYYLLNPEEDGERRFKLLLSQTDRDTLKAIVRGKALPPDHSLRLKKNQEFFREKIQKTNTNLPMICKGLAKLIVVDIALSREQDNPQLIFESMNSTGKELSQADLIRNFILMGLEPKLQATLYEDYWRPMELDFGQEAYGSDFDRFMRHYLTVKTGDIPRIGDVYEAFKLYARSSKGSEVDDTAYVETLIADMREFTRYFCAMALGAEVDVLLQKAFRDLRELKVDVAYPFLLTLYRDYVNEVLEKEEFIEIIRLVESYVFRRAICSIPTNSLNKTFANFTKSIDKDHYLESIKAHFLLLPSYRRFPRGEEFRREMQVRDLYNFRTRSYWLRRFENHNRKEYVPVDDYTIEHIMPQSTPLGETWQSDLGEDWEHIHETWLHTLGNLTLTGYNSELSNRPFREKRDIEKGFRNSPLRVNEGLGNLDSWNEKAIKDRASKLADHALEVWSEPKLDNDTLDGYAPRTAEVASYSIENHPYLLSGKIVPLFEAFRKEVLNLDSCVTETFQKYYVAYKAESNFVDLVPQSKRLRLTVNLKFSEVSDPSGICEDATGKGQWGNGDVRLSIANMEDLPHAIGIIRQAMEKQLGEHVES